MTTSPEGASEPEEKQKWRAEYNKRFACKSVVLFEDNDDPGKALADHISTQIHPFADSIHRIAFADKPEKYDIADWIEEHSADPERMIDDLERMIQSAPLWKPSAQQARVAADPSQKSQRGVWDADDAVDLLEIEQEEEVPWLDKDERIIAKEKLSQMYAPRGLGKSVYILWLVIRLAIAGFKVLLLDKDNPKSTVYKRLRELGSPNLNRGFLKVITRNAVRR